MNKNFPDACVLCDADQRVEMFLVRMDAAVGEQTPEMQRAVAGLELGEKFNRRRWRD
jgi:hypothetical protein